MASTRLASPLPSSLPVVLLRWVTVSNPDSSRQRTWKLTVIKSLVGSVVGPAFANALKQQLGEDKVAVQGVDYAADAGGIATEVTGGAGTQAMVADVQKAVQKCPDTQIVISGYSQGAMLVHNTANKLSADQAGKVKAAVTFGDPFKSQALKNVPEGAFKTFCATSDPVCGAGGVGAIGGASSGGSSSTSTSGHLGYGSDAGTAATFVKGKVQV